MEGFFGVIIPTSADELLSALERVLDIGRVGILGNGVAQIHHGRVIQIQLIEILGKVEPVVGKKNSFALVFLETVHVVVETVDADEKIGVEIIRKALAAPVRTIAQNAGFEGSVVVEKIKDLPEGEGLNSANGEWGNMIEMGVLDPVKVTRTTLQNAASIASLILITEATVSDEPKDTTIEEAISAAAAQGGQGGAY